MRSLRTYLLLTGAALLLGGPVPRIGAQGPDMAVIVHPSNGVDVLGEAELEAIFTSSKRHWPSGENIVPFNYPPNDVLRVAFDRAVLGRSSGEVSKFWINQRIRGRPGPPRQVPTSKLMRRVVERLPQAIGYVPVDEARRVNVKIVAIVSGREVRAP